MNPLLLSGSSLNVFLECPEEWKYQYLWRREMPPSYKMALGIAAHEAVEIGFRAWREMGILPPLHIWTDGFDHAWAVTTVNSQPKNHQPAQSAEAHRQSGLACVRYYATQIAPTIDVVAFEEPIAITINGHVWTGTIDLIDRRPDGRLRLRDHKFTERPKPERYRWPMVGYYLAARERWDIAEVALDFIVRGKQPRLEQVLLDIGEADILQFATEIEAAIASIEAGRFPPLGRTSGACRWCPYRSICPDARR